MRSDSGPRSDISTGRPGRGRAVTIDVAAQAARLFVDYGVALSAWRASQRRVAVYNPEWTDHNESDPGITVLQLFAFLGESLLYRFNSVPALRSPRCQAWQSLLIRTPSANRATERSPTG